MMGILLSLLWFLAQTSNAVQGENRTISTLAARFERAINEHATSEKTVGCIYYTPPNAVHIVTNLPNWQHTIIHNTSMTFYYPAENKAIIITSQRPLEIPFITSFILGLQKDFGLSALNYQIDSYNTIKDTILTRWKKKIEQGNMPEKAYLKSVKNRLIAVEVKDSTKYSWSRILFSDFVNSPSGTEMASTLIKDKNDSNGKYHETISLKNIKFNSSFPDSILYFKIPANAKVERIEW